MSIKLELAVFAVLCFVCAIGMLFWGFSTAHEYDYEEKKNGKWIKISPAGIYECSVCGQNVMTQDIDAYRYCHGCGKTMEERNDGTD